MLYSSYAKSYTIYGCYNVKQEAVSRVKKLMIYGSLYGPRQICLWRIILLLINLAIVDKAARWNCSDNVTRYKVRQGNLECGVTWNAAHYSASWSQTKTIRVTLWDCIGRYPGALSYRGLQISNSSFVARAFCRHFAFLCNQIMQINLSDNSKLLTMALCTSNYPL